MVPGSSPGGPTTHCPINFGQFFIHSFNLSLTRLTGIFAAQDQDNIMKKICLAFFTLGSFLISNAQTTPAPKKDWKKATLEAPGDHIMVQLTSDHWSGAPDSITKRMSGLPRGLGFSIMLNKPFKSDPHWSVAFGLGINGSSIYFKNTKVDLTASGSVLPFKNLDSADHFKKYKLVTVFGEVPIELRYNFNPEKENKSWKAALGIKVGTMLNAHTKGKTLVNSSGATLNSYTLKESKRNFFNSNRIVATARIGMGAFSLVGTYQLSTMLRDGAGADIRPYQIGLCISGL